MSDVYAFDPDAAPDAEFTPGELACLVAGNRGRLLDARRTPVEVTRIAVDRGAFEVEIRGFEDVGARWELPLHDVGRFQFARDGARAPEGRVDEFEAAIRKFDREVVIEIDPHVAEATLQRLAGVRGELRDLLAGRGLDVDAHIARRAGDPRLIALLDQVLRSRGLADLDREFTTTFASNPRSGEIVKGHAIVLAELGLCPYRGKIVRDPRLFDGPGSKARRAEHILVRAAFAQEVWDQLGRPEVVLYRGAAADGALPPPHPGSFVSATFAKEVAEAHFHGGRTTQVAVLWRQVVPIARLFMTFLETAAMNQHYEEAEAILFADPANRAF